MDEISPSTDSASECTMVHGDVPPFRSIIDGTVIEGRRQYNEHMRKHGVVPYEAGSEKVRPQGRTPEDRKALREFIWEKVDRVNQGHKARD
jgi:hypothetical protein